MTTEHEHTVGPLWRGSCVGIRNGVSGVVISAKQAHERRADFWVSDAVRVRILPDMVPKLGLLGPSTIHRVLSAYSEAEGLREAFMQSGGKLDDASDLSLTRRIYMPARSVDFALRRTIDAMGALDRAIADLETKSSARERAVGRPPPIPEAARSKPRTTQAASRRVNRKSAYRQLCATGSSDALLPPSPPAGKRQAEYVSSEQKTVSIMFRGELTAVDATFGSGDKTGFRSAL